MVRAFGLTDSEHLFCSWFWVVIKDLIDHFGMYSDPMNCPGGMTWCLSFFLVPSWVVCSPGYCYFYKKTIGSCPCWSNRISLISADWKFEFSVFMLRTPCTHTPSLPSGLCMPQGVCPLCLIFIPVLLCVPASKDCLCLFIGLVSCLICVAKNFFRTVILVDDLDLSAPVLMLPGFFWWSSACRRSSAVMYHQILARWLCVCFQWRLGRGEGTASQTNFTTEVRGSLHTNQLLTRLETLGVKNKNTREATSTQ